MEDIIVPVAVVGMLFIGLLGMILHYVTKWKSQTGISRQDEALLDELHDLARRLDQRIETVERIVAADNPNWKDSRIADLSEQRRQLR
ncbi:envelope stress response membrane protein PspB [Sandarakinorhabdus cyanobacteriorum]|uniref:Envelope stress response membrane protein PspB n=1 Tax=Sandarakinorhabdus cyanobacteriorum TaxID=1981098 RepID=A0A255YQG5_9SPHN|nr:envelope stress response membrane protein PspB [Sandarakinorhabdus cyanobacteriorum]OYQ30660.1 envelope stress response membrane protein PspB [Sandarakinorhabdus cyanobacteriorum]